MPPKERRAALWMDDAATRDANADAPPVPLVAINHCALGVSDLDNMAKCAAPSLLVLLLSCRATSAAVAAYGHDSQTELQQTKGSRLHPIWAHAGGIWLLHSALKTSAACGKAVRRYPAHRAFCARAEGSW